VLSISEIVGMEGDVITMQDIFVFDRQGIGEEGEVLGRFRPTGIRPRFAEILRTRGVELPGLMFIEGEADRKPSPRSGSGARGW
jgi:pilus assembly protein CpaF